MKSLVFVAVLAFAMSGLSACDEDPPTSGARPRSTAAASDPFGVLPPLGEAIDVGGLRVRVDVKKVGGDKNGPWLLVKMRVKNLGKRSLGLPDLRLECAEPTTIAYMIGDGTSVAPGRSVSKDVRLLISDTGRAENDYYAPIPPCGASASISVWVTSGRPDYTEERAGWRVRPDTLDGLNASLPFTRPGGEPKDPDRPYAWTAEETLPDGYHVVFVPGITAEQALDALAPVRGKARPDDFWGVTVAQREDGVVLFTSGGISEERVRALSRGGHVVASYSNTVNGDDHVLVVRDGKVVRSFDPFLAYDYVKTKPLPEEKGLDLENDTWAASWTLLERLTNIHVTEEWLLDGAHPAYLLKD